MEYPLYLQPLVWLLIVIGPFEPVKCSTLIRRRMQFPSKSSVESLNSSQITFLIRTNQSKISNNETEKKKLTASESRPESDEVRTLESLENYIYRQQDQNISSIHAEKDKRESPRPSGSLLVYDNQKKTSARKRVTSRGREIIYPSKNAVRHKRFEINRGGLYTRKIFLHPNFLRVLKEGRSSLENNINEDYSRSNRRDESAFYSALFGDYEDEEPEYETFQYNPQPQYWRKPLYKLYGPPYDHYRRDYFPNLPQYDSFPPQSFTTDIPSTFSHSYLYFPPPPKTLTNFPSYFKLQPEIEKSSVYQEKPPSLFFKVEPETTSLRTTTSTEPYFAESEEEDEPIQKNRINMKKMIIKKTKLRSKFTSNHLKEQPSYTAIPETSFTCRGRAPGMYADEDAQCQVWHTCESETRHHSFLCPNGTAFSQSLLTCDWWFKVDCDSSKSAENFEPHKANTVLSFPSKEKLQIKVSNQNDKSEVLYTSTEGINKDRSVFNQKKPLFQEFVPYESDEYPLFRLLSTRKFANGA